MDQTVGFDELRWLQELTVKSRRAPVPEAIGARLVTRGLVERAGDGFTLTARGRIAIVKLG